MTTVLKIETRSILCPLCGQTHTVEHADWINERGNRVSEKSAVLCAHYRAEIAATSARPFQLFRTPAAAQPVVQTAPRTARVEADVKHEPTPGYFLPDWDAFKKSKKPSKKSSKKAAR